MKAESMMAGIDIGSTTVKTVICDGEGSILFSRYRRHHALTTRTLQSILEEAYSELGNIVMDVAVTGSAGMGIAETLGLPFIQEVVASSKLISNTWPATRTFLEIGGEDSKAVFFDDHFSPDMRMNGSCAGGTGAFIDQMATLLDVPVEEFDELARSSTCVHIIASRCGVFAKTDVQALLSNNVPREDIAASVFRAVALQTASTLLRGRSIEKKVLFGGGPLSFLPGLRQAFVDVLSLDETTDLICPDHPELIAATGAALFHGDHGCTIPIRDLIERLETRPVTHAACQTLPPLFTSKEEFMSWQSAHRRHTVQRVDLGNLDGQSCFLGIDSGSTTTKLILMDQNNSVALSYYCANNGDPIAAVASGLAYFRSETERAGISLPVARAASTGYGEDLIKAAFGMDDGVVETVAHYRAARAFRPDVSFILDIGGQDMKAIFIRDNTISDIQINEACSSGCGSFMETFAHSLGYDIGQFAALACDCDSPFDLGTRCTVFMNSKIKQAQREGASIAEISAGLAYSVIRNSLYKVLKLRDVKTLGNNIVVQGGTFRNPAVLKAFEILTGRDAICPDIAELMGAYGAAITAKDNYRTNPSARSDFVGFDACSQSTAFDRETVHCKGCENRCQVTVLEFSGGRKYFTGNRCEKVFNNTGRRYKDRRNLVSEKYRLLFDRPLEPEGKPILTFGIPRALNMYENFPFWCSYLTSCGFRLVLSSPSGSSLLEKGSHSVMSENICLPGKLMHGHIFDLIEKGVDRIFYPNVVFEQKEFISSCNSFNCPVVTGYPDVIRNSLDAQTLDRIPLDSPAISFKDDDLLEKQLYAFVRLFKVSRGRSALAFRQALASREQFRKQVRDMGTSLVEQSARSNQPLIVLCGRPYHIDPLINHGIPELLTGMGVHVATEDAVAQGYGQALRNSGILTQWEYANRILAAAEFTSAHDNMRLVQLTSFGCGLDAVSSDETRTIMEKTSGTYTLIKIDEMTNLGAVKIRLRSFLETSPVRAVTSAVKSEGKSTAAKTAIPQQIIVPWVSPLYSPLIPPLFSAYGYTAEVLEPPDRTSVDLGLTHVNNDICYPAAIIIGDIIKALQSGKYDPDHTTVILPQTFGQCRASNYLPLAKKALQSAGFAGNRVVSMSLDQDGVQTDLSASPYGFVLRAALGVVFSDALARLYYATAARETTKGAAARLHARYLEQVALLASQCRLSSLLETLGKAVAEFNALETSPQPIPAVGVLGEIYVKYNAFANDNILEWLWSQHVEVMVPQLLGFFTQSFVNEWYDQKNYMKRSAKDRVLYGVLEYCTNHLLSRVESVMQAFCYYRRPHDIRKLASEASKTVSLANQAGEGWLLVAEMIAMLDDGVRNIVCMQPFGCLANHITGKGISRGLKDRYPDLTLLFLDMDAGHSEVNLLNRLHCMIMATKEDHLRLSNSREKIAV